MHIRSLLVHSNSGCQNEGNDSDDFASDRAVTYAESDHESVPCKSKRRRRSPKNPTSSSPREPLMLPKDDEQAELMFKLYRKAKEMERQLKEENKMTRLSARLET